MVFSKLFCNFLEIKAERKKIVGVKFVPFEVLYSCVKFRRLKMETLYIALSEQFFYSSKDPYSYQDTEKQIKVIYSKNIKEYLKLSQKNKIRRITRIEY